jgi:hypothetical protein
MKIGFFLVLFVLQLSFFSGAQKASYTHQTIRLRQTDELQLIANVSGMHHVLVFRINQKPLLHVYDQSLKLYWVHEIADLIPEKSDIQLVRLKDYYFLFTHVSKSDKYQLWKIDAQGIVQDMLPALRELIKNTFKDNKAAVQMNTDSKDVFLTTQVYYSELGGIYIERVKTDSLLNPLATYRFSCPFDIEKESLQQIIPVGDRQVLMLKRGENENNEHVLELAKYDLQSGKIEATQFNIHSNIFLQPVMRYNPVDSTIIIYSLVREPFASARVRRVVFLTKLNSSLEPVAPAKLLKSPNHFTFYLVDDLNWLHFIDARLSFYAHRPFTNWYSGYSGVGDYDPNFELSIRNSEDRFYRNDVNSKSSNGIRFSIVDKDFKVVSDSVLAIDKKGFTIKTTGFGKFKSGKKNYLILEQQLPNKSTGLLLFSGSTDQKIEISELNVYNRYRYFLSQVQETEDGSALIPYIYKMEAGLMKLNMYPRL